MVTGTMELYDVPFSWEIHHPNWLIFFRGVGWNHQQVIVRPIQISDFFMFPFWKKEHSNWGILKISRQQKIPKAYCWLVNVSYIMLHPIYPFYPIDHFPVNSTGIPSGNQTWQSKMSHLWLMVPTVNPPFSSGISHCYVWWHMSGMYIHWYSINMFHYIPWIFRYIPIILQ